MRDISDEDLTALLVIEHPVQIIRAHIHHLQKLVNQTAGKRSCRTDTRRSSRRQDQISQFSDSMYNAPSVPYWRSYHAAINFRGVDPGTLSGRQVNEIERERYGRVHQETAETEMTDWGLAGLRGCTVHGHSLRLQEMA